MRDTSSRRRRTCIRIIATTTTTRGRGNCGGGQRTGNGGIIGQIHKEDDGMTGIGLEGCNVTVISWIRQRTKN
jgi:hypothetical protein